MTCNCVKSKIQSLHSCMSLEFWTSTINFKYTNNFPSHFPYTLHLQACTRDTILRVHIIPASACTNNDMQLRREQNSILLFTQLHVTGILNSNEQLTSPPLFHTLYWCYISKTTVFDNKHDHSCAHSFHDCSKVVQGKVRQVPDHHKTVKCVCLHWFSMTLHKVHSLQ